MNTQSEQKITLEEFARAAGDIYPLAQSLACELLRYSRYSEDYWLDTAAGWERRIKAAFNFAIPEEDFDEVEVECLTDLYLKFGGFNNKNLEN